MPSGVRLRDGEDRRESEEHATGLREAHCVSAVRGTHNGRGAAHGIGAEPDDESHLGLLNRRGSDSTPRYFFPR